MKRKGLVILAILVLAAVLLIIRKVSAQSCPPPTYTNQVDPWDNGSVVDFSFDASGTGVGDPSNPPPKFSLTSGMETSMSNGITGWNSHSSANGSSIVFSGASGKPWIISTACISVISLE